MNPTSRNPKPDQAIQTTLAGLRRRIRAHAWARGFCAAAVGLGAAFWGVLLVDWFFEPPRAFRLLVLVAGALGLIGLPCLWIGRRAFARLSDANLAMLLERHFPLFGDSLLTAVVLDNPLPESQGADLSRGEVAEEAVQPLRREIPAAETPHLRRNVNPAMLARTVEIATGRLAEVRPAEVLDRRPLHRGMVAALALALSIAIFAGLAPQAMGVWARRSLMLSDELWPRRTRLEMVGFKEGVMKVARGGDIEIIAKADMNMPLVPNTVHVRYRAEGGPRVRTAMIREGNARAGHDAFQPFSHVFRNVITPIDFEVVGGDARLSGLRIEVVDSPVIDQMMLHCRYPDYMKRKPQTLPVIGVMRIAQGTQVTVEGRANKKLIRVEARSALDDAAIAALTVEPSGEKGFQCPLGAVEKDQTLLFTLLDADEIRSPEPVRLVLASAPDESPECSVRLEGIGEAVTPQARLPLIGVVRDDHGIAQAWVEWSVDQSKPGEQPMVSTDGNPTELKIDRALELHDLAIQPGWKLALTMKAADRCDRPGGPNVGASQTWTLDVVTPERLRLMLQARELVLRQRFEAILEEVAETRDSLLRMEFEAAPATAPVSKSQGAEPGDAASEARPTNSDDEVIGPRRLRCERAVQNGRKNADETRGVAEAFDAVRLELINNRIDTEELKQRLASGIAEPLRRIASEMFPELEKRLARLRQSLADAQTGPKDRDFARQQVDAILVAMNAVLARMIELEDFNEVVALLREIIDSQRELGEHARERQKTMLQDLLEDKP